MSELQSISRPLRMVPLSEPCLNGRERDYLLECIDTNYVSSVGPFVERFENEFAGTTGSRFAVATSNGTAAIHVALRLLNVEPGDEVIVSTFTFVASVNPIRYLGARPVLIDSESTTWNLDPGLLEEELAKRAPSGKLPKAIIAVHIYGQPADMPAIMAIASRYNVPVIEDAAESLGATVAGKAVGTFGTIGCFSFNGNKIMTTGGGGMIVTDDTKLAARAKHLVTQARLPGLAYDHDEVGYNYRLTNLNAALGVAQLEQLPEFLRRKREIAQRYRDMLQDIDCLTLMSEASDVRSSWWLFSLLIDFESRGLSRDTFVSKLREHNVESRPLWRPVHTMALYRDASRIGGSVAERLFAGGASLPCSVGLTADEQTYVAETVRNVLLDPR